MADSKNYTSLNQSEQDASLAQINNKLKVFTSLKMLTRAKWDIGSPKFKLACVKLGIDPTLLRIKHKDEFSSPNTEEEVQNLRYKHHLNKVKDLVNEIIIERKSIAQLESKNNDEFIKKKNQLFSISSHSFVQNITINNQSKTMSRSNSNIFQNRHNVRPNDSVSSFDKDPNNQDMEQEFLNRRKRLFRDIHVKIVRQQNSKEILDKQLKKLQRSTENVYHLKLEQQEKFVKESEKRVKINQRYQQILKQQEEKSYKEYEKLAMEGRNKKNTLQQLMSVDNIEKKPSSCYDRYKNSESINGTKRARDEELERQMQKFQMKMQRSSRTYEEMMQNKIKQVHDINVRLKEKMHQALELKAKREHDEIEKNFNQQLKYQKKLLLRNEMMSHQNEQQTEKKKRQEERYLKNKSQEDNGIQSRYNDLQQKFERAEQMKQQFIENKEHDKMIKQELRKLKDEDKHNLHERIKKQMMNKKFMILYKEKEHENQIQYIKQKENELQRLKREFEMKVSIDKERVRNGVKLSAIKSLPQVEGLEQFGVQKRDLSAFEVQYQKK